MGKGKLVRRPLLPHRCPAHGCVNRLSWPLVHLINAAMQRVTVLDCHFFTENNGAHGALYAETYPAHRATG